ncbi:hypothetical protein GGE07_005971 [Sinorhizobium terangae]|uniref:Uncharacterized protein n=1 Tax=Sinorhizobium terangae TaxID=110322 RepID=A0A6N7LKA6_SINTE|nr:hypothetical protein [Sinorhizobium terangae]MBB4189289.1 hypothetical protein [Sinorhizobium terangae]MQX18197.1 hypothetical protein [Sinorhizobium terangae]
MPNSKEDIRGAIEKLAHTEYATADPTDVGIMVQLYTYESNKSFDTERTVLDITKANFAVFGSVMLIGNSSFFAHALRPGWAIAISTVTICIISLAASALSTFYDKYFTVHRQKVSILQRGVWRKRPLDWVESKYVAADLKTKFEDSASLGIIEYIRYNYTLKWINLIPLFVALIVGLAYIFFGEAATPAPAGQS